MFRAILLIFSIACFDSLGASDTSNSSPEAVLSGLRKFYAKTSRADGSFSPGIDPDYRGMSDSAYSDLAAVTYPVTIYKTFGWKPPREKQTMGVLLTRQRKSGKFFKFGGTRYPPSSEGLVYITTQGKLA